MEKREVGGVYKRVWDLGGYALELVQGHVWGGVRVRVRGCGREICRVRVGEITNLDIVGLKMNVGGWGKR